MAKGDGYPAIGDMPEDEDPATDFAEEAGARVGAAIARQGEVAEEASACWDAAGNMGRTKCTMGLHKGVEMVT